MAVADRISSVANAVHALVGPIEVDSKDGSVVDAGSPGMAVRSSVTAAMAPATWASM